MRERFEKIVKIIERAEAIGIAKKDRVTHLLDIENADKQFNLDLDDWMDADDGNFAHDFIGIYNHMNRRTGLCEDFFVPRFAYAERRHAI